MRTRETIAERVKVMQSWLDGEPIQYRVHEDHEWCDFEEGFIPKFQPSYQYRVKPLEPDKIDWCHVAPRFKFMARDYSGNAYLYECKPNVSHIEFYCNETDRLVLADEFASFRRGSVDWADSLVCRPEGV